MASVYIPIKSGCHNPIYLPQEVLRLYPAAALFDRIAVQDAVIPLTDSIETATGELMNQVLVRKGQILTLAVASYQRFESSILKAVSAF
jgi:hypothetical protein